MQNVPIPTPPDDLRSPPIATLEKPPRHRVIQACLPCHHSKRKCNRKKPCSQCMKRHASGGCVYESVAPENLDALQQEDATIEDENRALRSRIADLEAAIADYKSSRRTNNLTHKKRRTQEEGKEPESSDKGVYYGDSYYLGSSAAPDLLQRMSKLVPQDNTDLLGAFAGSSVGALHPGYYAFPTLFSATQGVKELTEILHNIGRQHCDFLLDAFYDIVDPLHHYIPRAWFMARYERCWGREPDSSPAQEVALIYAVLALGDSVTNKTYAVLMISTSMQLLRISNFLANPSMECIAAFCFIAVYLQYEGKLGEFWPLLGLVIRLAQSMALHRDPSAVMKVSEAEAELRRRIFYSLAAQETAISSMFGRPEGLPYTDCKLPRDVSDSDLFGSGPNKIGWENSGLNEISFNRFSWELGSITREILKNASHDLEDERLSERQAYESRIERWLVSLPPHFRYDNTADLPTTPTNYQARNRIVQSIILHCLAKFNVLVLYRKPLLAGRPCDETRKACCEAAFEVADGWRLLQDNFPAMARMTWGHWFLAFHSALICLVVIRTDGPRSSMRPRALDCWANFLRIFTKIQDHNTSINNCWRALVRLDAAVKREDRKKDSRDRDDQRPQSLQRHQGASLAKLLNKSEKEIAKFSDNPSQRRNAQQALTPYATAASKSNLSDGGGGAGGHGKSASSYPVGSMSSLSTNTTHQHQPRNSEESFQGLLGVNMLFGTAPALPTPGFEMQGFDIFDMDAQHWPPWLTTNNSPTEGSRSDSLESYGRPGMGGGGSDGRGRSAGGPEGPRRMGAFSDGP